MSPRFAPALFAIVLGSSGCGVVFQSAVGWTDIERYPRTSTAGEEVVEIVKEPQNGAVWVGTAVEALIGAAFLAGGLAAGGMGGVIVAAGGAGGAGLLVLVDLLAASIQDDKEPVVLAHQYVGEPLLARSATTARSSARPWSERTIVLVDPEVDAGLDVAMYRELDDQLRSAIRTYRAQVITRSDYQNALNAWRARIAAPQAACHDLDCELQLAVKLQATHLLRPRAHSRNPDCALDVALFDVETRVLVEQVSTRGACSARGYSEMARSLAEQLVSGRRQ
jgi:hypothetical protein